MTTKAKTETAAPPPVTANPAAMITAQTEQAIGMAKASFEQIASQSQAALEQSLQAVGAITDMTRGNVDALLESSRAAAGGLQAMAQEAATFSQQSVERTAAAARELTLARTAPELMRLQSEFARAQFTTAIAEVSNMTQTIFQTMHAIFEPLQRQALIAAQIKDLMDEK